jgi:hypothetical protein
MPWIARDATGSNPYRIFGFKPLKLQMVSYGGDRLEGQYTWSHAESSGRQFNGGFVQHDRKTYAPLNNDEPTVLPEADSPVELEPGEGPVEVKLVLAQAVAARPWEGEGI